MCGQHQDYLRNLKSQKGSQRAVNIYELKQVSLHLPCRETCFYLVIQPGGRQGRFSVSFSNGKFRRQRTVPFPLSPYSAVFHGPAFSDKACEIAVKLCDGSINGSIFHQAFDHIRSHGDRLYAVLDQVQHLLAAFLKLAASRPLWSSPFAVMASWISLGRP